MRVDLNSDIGESYGIYKLGLDDEVMEYISSANIACGWHAGDPVVMERTVENALKKKVAVGAHPGFPDRMGFGRREMILSYEEVKCYVKYQIGALWAFVESKGAKLQHVKPHGALYNIASKNKTLSKAIAEAIYEVDKNMILVGLFNSELTRAGEEVGLKVANEVFADRAYNVDGTLVPRKQKGAFINDVNTATSRVIRMVKEGKVETINGEDISIKADTICVHGDNSQAVAFVKKIRKALEDKNLNVVSMAKFI